MVGSTVIGDFGGTEDVNGVLREALTVELEQALEEATMELEVMQVELHHTQTAHHRALDMLSTVAARLAGGEVSAPSPWSPTGKHESGY